VSKPRRRPNDGGSLNEGLTLEVMIERVALLEAEREIRRLASDYCHGFDRRQFDRFRRVWHDDAIWVPHPDQEIEGVNAIVAQAETMWLLLTASFHWTTNHLVDIDGEVAHGEADVNALVCINGFWAQAPGVYIDRYERRSGKWRIARRDASHEHQAFLVLHASEDLQD
jgi:ketosteroid isomerase-like protein